MNYTVNFGSSSLRFELHPLIESSLRELSRRVEFEFGLVRGLNSNLGVVRLDEGIGKWIGIVLVPDASENCRRT